MSCENGSTTEKNIVIKRNMTRKHGRRKVYKFGARVLSNLLGQVEGPPELMTYAKYLYDRVCASGGGVPLPSSEANARDAG